MCLNSANSITGGHGKLSRQNQSREFQVDTDLKRLQSMLAEQIYEVDGALERMEQAALSVKLLDPESQIDFLKAGAVFRALRLLQDISEELRAVEVLGIPEGFPMFSDTPPEAGENTERNDGSF